MQGKNEPVPKGRKGLKVQETDDIINRHRVTKPV